MRRPLNQLHQPPGTSPRFPARPARTPGAGDRRLMKRGDVQHGRRHGAVTVMVMIVLLLLAALVAQYARRAVADRRQMRQEFLHVQTQHLADAGVARAQAAMRDDENHDGETWTIPAGVIHQTNTAKVVISRDEGTVTVVATYPSNDDQPVKVTRKVNVK